MMMVMIVMIIITILLLIIKLTLLKNSVRAISRQIVATSVSLQDDLKRIKYPSSISPVQIVT